MTRRLIFATLVVIAGSAMMTTPVRAQSGVDVQVYGDALAPGWQNWSWNTAVNFSNPVPALGGSGASIAVTYNAAWAGFYLHSTSAIAAENFQSLRFWVHGGAVGGHDVQVVGFDSAGAAGGSVAMPSSVAGQWVQVDVPVMAFGVARLSGFAWQDTSGGAQPTYYVDQVELIGGDPPPPPPPAEGPAIVIDAQANRHAISPYIYGINFAEPELAVDLQLPVRRWGGNATTRYNWQKDTSNRASDWFFENIPNANPNPDDLPDGSASDDFVEENLATGTETIMTVPLIGWTPKEREVDCGFSVSLYGPQQATDPYNSDCGNGVHLNGTFVTGNDPHDTSVEIGPDFVQAWIAHLVSRYGTAAQGGVRFYNLDNEPMLWNSTHRDVHPQPTSYDEMRERTYAYAAAIKAADPGALTLGPVLWGWTAYFYSALDQAAGGDWWNDPVDQIAHGNVPFVEWYLQQMAAYEQANGVRILDYLDLHYYPQASGVALQPAGGPATQALRLRSTRSLWDPTYADESWIGTQVRLIPRMHEWVNDNYPGTMLAMTEYNWGGMEHINGALAQADVLGIFGREDLGLATLWAPPDFDQPGAFAFRMYRNYDGRGGTFGAMSVLATSADQEEVSAYAALADDDDAMTVMLINKTAQPLTSPLTLMNYPTAGAVQVYRYSGADLSQIVQEADIVVGAGQTDIDLPAWSITLLVIPGDAVVCTGDVMPSGGDGEVNIDDLFGMLGAWGTGDPQFDVSPRGGNGVVDIDDLFEVIGGWGDCP